MCIQIARLMISIVNTTMSAISILTIQIRSIIIGTLVHSSKIIFKYSTIYYDRSRVAVFSYIGHCDYDNDDVNPPTLKNNNTFLKILARDAKAYTKFGPPITYSLIIIFLWSTQYLNAQNNEFKKSGQVVPFCCTLEGGVDLGLGITYEELCIKFSNYECLIEGIQKWLLAQRNNKKYKMKNELQIIKK
ncbi:hypothetical protein AGLY_012766 [Aphis glycines]|uniref:Uncharacterized protein n=1 Tax=Aphis glycines TaxID=307491 RepID=A0A6G0TA62_APHGL|nr:hypothetical protein AGLY_012766 [Aphis glycines]